MFFYFFDVLYKYRYMRDNVINLLINEAAMIVNFKEIIYDTTEDVPLLVLVNDLNKTFFLRTTFLMAETFLQLSKNKNYTPPLFSFFIDLLQHSNGIINKLEIIKCRLGEAFGEASINFTNSSKIYDLTSDQIIFLSVLYKKPVKINPEVFIDIINYNTLALSETQSDMYQEMAVIN